MNAFMTRIGIGMRAVVMGAGLLVCVGGAAADPVFSENFEPPRLAPGAVAGQQDWSGAGSVEATPSTAPNGGVQSARINLPGGPLTQVNMARPLSITATGQIVTLRCDMYWTHTDFQTQASFGVFLDSGANIGLSGAGTVAGLATPSAQGPLVAASANAWHRCVLVLNFTNNTVTGSIDGVSLGSVAMPSGARVTSLAPALVGTTAASAFFDNISIETSLPQNNFCADALPVSPGQTLFNNTGATYDGPLTTACNVIPLQNVWYTFTPSAAGPVTVSTCTASFDTVLAVYTGPCTALGGDVACDDDFCGTGSSVTFGAAAGQTYRISLGAFNTPTAGFGHGVLSISQSTTGACCNPKSGQCSQMEPAACSALGLNFGGIGVACSPTNCRACPGDFDLDGSRTIDDIFIFLNAWFAGCP